MFENVFNGMFGKIAPGMCRLTMNGSIAIKTSNGYKSYNVKSKRLTNCSNFVFNIGEDFFFCIPTNKVAVGDIILFGGKPKCVVKADKDTITAINYEDSTVETILPERHVFMGNTYFYGKVVSMFGGSFVGKGKKNTNQIMKYMMMSEMFKGNGGTHTYGDASNGMSNMLPMMMMFGGGNGFSEMFDGMFDDFGDDVDEDVDDEEDEDTDSSDKVED